MMMTTTKKMQQNLLKEEFTYGQNNTNVGYMRCCTVFFFSFIRLLYMYTFDICDVFGAVVLPLLCVCVPRQY